MWQRSYVVIDKPKFLRWQFQLDSVYVLADIAQPDSKGAVIFVRYGKQNSLDNVVLLLRREYVIHRIIPEFYRIYRTARPTTRTFYPLILIIRASD